MPHKPISHFDRSRQLKAALSQTSWDVIIIGGGATGLGAALDATSRGLKTLLLERADFAQETSSRSTKLVHGGVRYLRQGRVGLVREALRERARLLQNAPHLVHPLPFLLPSTSWISKIYYYIGIKLYDLLAGRLKFGPSSMLTQSEMLAKMPNISPSKLSGGILYFDGQFDDARLALNLAQTIIERGGLAINYMNVQELIQDNNRTIGVVARDMETGETYPFKGKTIINATGVFVDSIRRLGNTTVQETIIPSQGAHIVLDRKFYPSEHAMIIPETSDGRVLFAIPWHNYVLIGTTDISVDKITRDPKPHEEEISYLLEGIADYLVEKPTREDILSHFAGLRPLVKPKGDWTTTAALSRDFALWTDPSGLITVTGGKWTTYRKMGEDTIDKAVQAAGFRTGNSTTKDLPIHGAENLIASNTPWSYYGTDENLVSQLGADDSSLLDRYHPDLPCRPVDVIWGVRNEMARHLQDILARRTRCLFLNAKASIEIAPRVAHCLAKELGRDKAWELNELEAYTELAERYLPD